MSSMQHATENCLYPKLVVELLRLQLNFTFPLEHVTKHIVLRERMSSVAVEKFGVAGKKTLKWMTLLFRKKSVASFNWNIGTLLHSLQIVLRPFPMRLLPLWIRNRAICKLSVGYWSQTLVTAFILQTLSEVKNTASSSGSTSSWCENLYGSIPMFAVSTRFLPFFISSRSDKLKSPDLKYFVLSGISN